MLLFFSRSLSLSTRSKLKQKRINFRWKYVGKIPQNVITAWLKIFSDEISNDHQLTEIKSQRIEDNNFFLVFSHLVVQNISFFVINSLSLSSCVPIHGWAKKNLKKAVFLISTKMSLKTSPNKLSNFEGNFQGAPVQQYVYMVFDEISNLSEEKRRKKHIMKFESTKIVFASDCWCRSKRIHFEFLLSALVSSSK